MSDWQRMDTAPEGVPIKVGHKSVKMLGGWWEGTGIFKRTSDDDRLSDHVTLIHYNGEIMLHAFYATHWKPLDKPPST